MRGSVLKLARIRSVKDAVPGSTINDVVLAMCAGALRSYLDEQHALPETPLVAMVPVSLRGEHEQDAGGNMVGTILCNLATDVVDPMKRLETISGSMRDNKRVFSELPRTQALALSGFLVAGLGLSLVPGFVSSAPPPFNIVISNVPGARTDVLEWRQAGRQLPTVHCPGWAGTEHHPHQQRGQSGLRTGRVPAQRAASAEIADPPGGFAVCAGAGRRNLTRRLRNRHSRKGLRTALFIGGATAFPAAVTGRPPLHIGSVSAKISGMR